MIGLLALGLLAASPAWAARYASIVIEADSGRVLHAANPDMRSYPASLTKVMTLFLLFDSLESGKITLDTRFPVSAHAAKQAPSKLGLRPGETISVRDIVLSLVTKSANDAAVVAAEGLSGGSEADFARIMTAKARSLGMTRTTYLNASGLPNPGQMSTARDQAILARALINRHAGYYRYFSTRNFVWKGQTITTHNRLMLRYPGADGIKTGYIQASGFNLISSARRDDQRIIGVVFGGASGTARDNHMKDLLDRGFSRLKSGESVELAAAPSADDTSDIDDLLTAAKTVPAAAAAGAAGRQSAKAARPPGKSRTEAKTRTAKTQQPAAAKTAKAAKAGKGHGHINPVGDTDPESWSIQLGRFEDAAPARKAANNAVKKLGRLAVNANVDIGKIKGRNPVYVARLAGFTPNQARTACQRLGAGCKTIAPN